jgi:hypothetical protein
VWESVQAALEKPADTPDAPLDDTPQVDGPSPPQALLLAMLFANGWFLKPNFFIHKSGNESAKDMMKLMRVARLRLVGFITGWIAAFAFLPVWIPVLALVGWIAIVAPQILALIKRAQNVAPGEEPG